MSSHLARPSSTRPSQDPIQRRLRRLSFKPLAETTGETNGVDEQTTLKVPAATLHYVKRRREFLVAPKRPQRKEQQQKSSSTGGDEQEQEKKTRSASPHTTGVEGRSKEKVPASPEIDRSQVEHEQTVPLTAQKQQNGHLPDALDASEPDTLILDTLDASEPDTLVLESPEVEIDDDPQFGKHSTIPMVVLSGIAAQQGKAQSEMRSDVSGAAGAASLMGLGSIIGNILKYVGAFLIQYGFGAGGYGLYTLCLSLISLISATFNLGLDDAM